MRSLAILSRRSILSGFADQAALEQIRLFLETGVQVPEVSNGDSSSRLHETFGLAVTMQNVGSPLAGDVHLWIASKLASYILHSHGLTRISSEHCQKLCCMLINDRSGD
jgi:hypothetical protein